MSVIDKLSSISDTLSSIFQYAQQNPEIKEDFDEYLKTIGAYNAPASELSAILVTYVFERYFHKGVDSVFSMYLKDKTDIDSNTKNIVQALQNSIDALLK